MYDSKEHIYVSLNGVVLLHFVRICAIQTKLFRVVAQFPFLLYDLAVDSNPAAL